MVSLPTDRQIKRFGRDAVASERTTRHSGYTGSSPLEPAGWRLADPAAEPALGLCVMCGADESDAKVYAYTPSARATPRSLS